MTVAVLFSAAVAAASPAGADGWNPGLWFHFGPKERQHGPYYPELPPPYYYGRMPTAFMGPAPEARPIRPKVIFARLADAGYSDFSALAYRGSFYRMRAINRRGDLVSLDVNAYDARIERVRVLAKRSWARPGEPWPPVVPPTLEECDPLILC